MSDLDTKNDYCKLICNAYVWASYKKKRVVYNNTDMVNT